MEGPENPSVFPLGPGSNFCNHGDTCRPASGEHQRAPAHGASATGGPKDSGSASVKSSERNCRLVENKLVKQREIQTFKLAKLAGTASEQRGWVNAILAYIRRFDATTLGTFLWEWTNKIFQHGMTGEKPRNSEGCPHLDAMIASEIMQQHHFADLRCPSSTWN